jgi:DUF2075 family protein
VTTHPLTPEAIKALGDLTKHYEECGFDVLYRGGVSLGFRAGYQFAKTRDFHSLNPQAIETTNTIRLHEAQNKALHQVLDEKQKIIVVMYRELLSKGVNFDFDKALERYDDIQKKILEEK